MQDAHFYVYNAGHGVCTLLTGKIEVENEIVPYCGIFDCGSKSHNPFCGKAAIICDMKKKILNNAQGHSVQIDDVVISHQDIDHWNMLIDLFVNLNSDEYIEYKGSFFGNNSHAWKLTNTGVYEIIHENDVIKIKKRGYSTNSEYSASVKYLGEDMISAKVNIFVKDDRSSEWIKTKVKYCYNYYECKGCLDIIIKRDSGNENEDLYINPIIRPITYPFPSIDILIGEVKPIFQDSRTICGILGSIAASLSPDELQQLEEELNDDSFISISVPIKRMVMGGGEIGSGYAQLKDLFFYMSRFYGSYSETGNPAFLWTGCGAYIVMANNLMEKIERQFPPYCVETVGFGTPIIRNLTSAVVQFNIASDNIILLPGDITQHGFKEIVKVASTFIPEGSLKLMLAPHHGSDNTNFAYEGKKLADLQPLYYLFDELLVEESECNLVISGYNSNDCHPGELFTFVAGLSFSDDAEEHPVAYADGKNTGIDIDEYIESLEITSDCTLRIFTTNALPLYDTINPSNYIYFKYYKMTIEFEPIETLTVPNLKRRLPPDSVFI